MSPSEIKLPFIYIRAPPRRAVTGRRGKHLAKGTAGSASQLVDRLVRLSIELVGGVDPRPGVLGDRSGTGEGQRGGGDGDPGGTCHVGPASPSSARRSRRSSYVSGSIPTADAKRKIT